MNNWDYFGLQPSFDNIRASKGKPSDLDMFYITQDKFLIIGEFKNGDFGELDKQRWLFETYIDNYKYDGIVIYATHHNRVEYGDKTYDASLCGVEEYYYKGKWHKPNNKITVQDVFNKFDKEKNMNIIDEREKTIFRNEYEGKVSYSIGLSKKKEDGTFENGYMPIRFKKGTELKDKTKIKIKEAWLDFYKADKKTIPYIFVNKFEMASDLDAIKQVTDVEEMPFY